MKRDTRKICSFFHCGACLDEIPDGISPEAYARFSVGWTRQGLQVWCLRHRLNVVHLDFEGRKIALAPP